MPLFGGLQNNQTKISSSTKPDGNGFFHAVFGENSSNSRDNIKTETVKAMRGEWHTFLSQFRSLNDTKMPSPLKDQLEKIFNSFLYDSSHNRSDKIERLVSETKEAIKKNEIKATKLVGNIVLKLNKDEAFRKKIDQALRKARSRKNKSQILMKDLFKDKKMLEYEIRNYLKDCALSYYSHLTDEKFYETYSTQVVVDSFLESQDLYSHYLSAIQRNDHFVCLEEIPILASLANIKIQVYYKYNDQDLEKTFYPKNQLLNDDYKKNLCVWDYKKLAIIHYEGLHFFPGLSSKYGKDLHSDLMNENSEEEFYDTNDGQDQNMSCDSDTDLSDLESIPTLSHFKQYDWKGGQPKSRAGFEEKEMSRKIFGKDEYIEGQWKNNQLVDLISGQFIHPRNDKTVYIRKQKPGYLLTFDQVDFIARVSFENLEEFSFSKNAIDTKRNFLKKIKVTEIIKDELLNGRNEAYRQFERFLQNISDKTSYQLKYAEDIFQLSLKMEAWRKYSSNISILTDIVKNQSISKDTINSSKKLLDAEKKLNLRKSDFSQIDKFYSNDLLKELQKICQNGVNKHRSALYHKYFNNIYMMAPSVMVDRLTELDNKSILYIRHQDIELFEDLVDLMKKQPYLDFIGDSWNAFFDYLEGMRHKGTLSKIAPLTHPVYFFLCKSFLQLVSEISVKTDIPIADLLKKNERGEWNLMAKIIWPSTSCLNKALEQQYRFIFTLIQHFQPGGFFTKSKFVYQFRVLQDSKQSTFSYLKNLIYSSNKTLEIPEERLLWLYIFDNAISGLCSADVLKPLKSLIQGFREFIERTEDDLHESFRMATHNVISFKAQIIPFLSNQISDINQTIITKQIETIKIAFLDRQASDSRDLIESYNEYWENREMIMEKIPDKFPYGKFKKDMEAIHASLYEIPNVVLDYKAETQRLLQFFRTFNEFLVDLNSLEFNWWIKRTDNLLCSHLKIVNADKNSYQITDPEKFIQNCHNIPRHYMIEIIQDLLASICNLLKLAQWSDSDTVNAAVELISAIKKSFIYLKDQPNYVSFDIFKEECTKPFRCVIEGSSSHEDFKKRIDIIGGSFWYLRKQDEIDIDKALELYGTANSYSSAPELKNCYNSYLAMFNAYIQETTDKIYQEKINYIVAKVKQQSSVVKFDEWDSTFKTNTIPGLLAGLAAVWSIKESKDIAGTGKSLKPHCIQILCILRLLSTDKGSKGVDKHLAQVLTGQGKSLILGLLSCILALTGHRVRTVCYSDYLASRDESDFNSFFKELSIDGNITYGTFQTMANEVLWPNVNGKRQGLRELVEGRILNQCLMQAEHIEQDDISNTVLLIDEVDVFFSDQFYGNTYNPCTSLKMPALASIQEKIWELASKRYEAINISEELEKFTNEQIKEGSQDFIEFNKFRFKPREYVLLKKENEEIITKKYTNRSLYAEHLEKMIDNAIDVAKGTNENWFINRYKLNENGIISYRDDGIYSTHTYCSYYNIFNYFRLKLKNYDKVNFQNYGYMNIDCGQVSYAKLPEKYPLILGVSGTITMLNEYEKKAIRESYSIRENSIMPSFFGNSKILFDPRKNVTVEDSEDEWLGKISNHAISKINSGRSVLTFFNTDIEIAQFQEKYLSKFSRLHVLTENTENRAKERYIEEAGITKTLTLATRGMGRGVDFKSSVTVESNGGMHVIQAFYSLDEKEEIQIRGRTARKDNKGSYELILCKEHLIKFGFLEDNESEASYECLNTSRNQIASKKGDNSEELIGKLKSKHTITMNYLESFFLKNVIKKESITSN